MAWSYTAEQIVSILAAVGVLAGIVLKGVSVILARIDETKAKVEEKTNTIEEKVDVVKVQSDGRLSSIEAALQASQQESKAMARELALIGELRRQEETTRRTLADEVARAAQVAQAMVAQETAQAVDRAHQQADQQHATASTEAPIVSSGPVTIAQVPSVTVEEADTVRVTRGAPKPPA